MRNIGGSIGIAATTTFIERRTQVHTNQLGERISAYSQQSRQMFEATRGALMAHGADAATAAMQARGALFGLVERHAAMFSFLETFRILGIIFLLVIPLLLLLKKPAHHGKGAMAH
jgi:DHA2 family multidrug resistance protein